MTAPSAERLKELFPDLSDAQTRELALAFANPRVLADDAMSLADRLLEGYGVEAIRQEDAWVSPYYQDVVALYVNMGDTYLTTILYDTINLEFVLASWGDYMEWIEEGGRGLVERGEEPEEPSRKDWTPR